MKTEDDDALWTLLGKAEKPTASPFFARNVLRQTRMSAPITSWDTWLRHRWQYACLGGLGLLLASLALIPQVETPEQTTIALAEKVSESPDYQVINHLDELLASEENLAWLEN